MALLLEIKVPLLAVNDTILTVVETTFRNGSFVKKGDIILVLETSKTTYDVTAEQEGYIRYDCIPGNEYAVNEIIAGLYSTVEEAAVMDDRIPVKQEAGGKMFTPAENWDGETVFSVAAQKLISSSGMDLSLFKGMDFVSRADVEAILKPTPAKSRSSELASVPVKSLQADPGSVVVEKLSTAKKREISYLREVQSAGLISTINNIVETDGIFTQLNSSLKYLKDSILPVVLYESSRLLEKYPLLNAYYTGDGIAYYKQVDIGFAVDIDKGLKVLKVPATSQKTMQELESSIMELSNRYLDESLEIDHLTGISFTITDLSSEGVQFFTPLVNMLNSAILGISSVDRKLDRCILSLSFDHRVTEGKYVSRFLSELKERLESYRTKYHGYPVQDISCYKCFKRLDEELSDVGFMKCITPQGKEGYICQNCLNGF